MSLQDEPEFIAISIPDEGLLDRRSRLHEWIQDLPGAAEEYDRMTEYSGRPARVTSTPGYGRDPDRWYHLEDELEQIKYGLTCQEKKVDDLAHTFVPSTRREVVEKSPLPPKYDGSTDFNTYLLQFQVLAHEQRWTEDRKGVMLISRLKGRALEIAAQGDNLTFSELVSRLRSHFSPDHEEMFAQQLQTLRKTSSQTWEDLAFEVRNLTRKGYRRANEITQERLAVHAFINAITEDDLRQRVRDSHPFSVEMALSRVRQVEADQAVERQRHSQRESSHQKEKAQVLQGEDDRKEIEELKTELQKLRVEMQNKDSRDRSRPQAGRVPRPGKGSPRRQNNGPRGRGSPRKNQNRYRCYFCDSRDHLVRDCPHKLAWKKQQEAKGQSLN